MCAKLCMLAAGVCSAAACTAAQQCLGVQGGMLARRASAAGTCVMSLAYAPALPGACCRAIRAGARETIYHDPKHTTCAIVTCGGLCPGLNDVVAVRARVLCTAAAPDLPMHWRSALLPYESAF